MRFLPQSHCMQRDAAAMSDDGREADLPITSLIIALLRDCLITATLSAFAEWLRIRNEPYCLIENWMFNVQCSMFNAQCSMVNV